MSKDITDVMPEFLTTIQAAKVLGRKQETLRRWSSQGSGPIRPIHIGRRLAWPVAEIEKLLGGRTFRLRPAVRDGIGDTTSQAAGSMSTSGDSPAISDKIIPPLLNPASQKGKSQAANHGQLQDESECRLHFLAELGLMPPAAVSVSFHRGELIEDVKLKCPPYRIERVLVDQDTQARFYILRRVDVNRELMRSHEMLENPECYRRYVADC